MDTFRTRYITDYFYNNHTADDFFRDRFFYLKLHALFNCLTTSEIKTLYFKYSLHSDKFKRTLLHFIQRKSESRSLDFSVIAKEIIENYPFQPYRLQLACRTFLSQVIQSLDNEIMRDYFQLFIDSARRNDRKKSYEISKYFWTDVEQTIWNNFYKFKDEAALTQIIYNSESFDLVTQLKNLWGKELPNNRLKMEIINKTRQEDISYFQFLVGAEPTFYLQALVVRNLTIEKKLLNSITRKMKLEKNGLLFYYLGLARNWKVLTETIKDMKTERPN